MDNFESSVAQHYSDGRLLDRILAGLEASGVDIDRIKAEQLAPIEEFHIGGRKATAHAVDKMFLSKDQHVLDIGCGIGGAARYIAKQAGCRVTGVDLTQEYIDIAKALSAMTYQEDRVEFHAASALDMPFENASFDAAITLHAAMNIADRAGLYSETARVLKPGSTLCLFDVMKKSDDDLDFPVPWASSGETSFLTTPEEMCTLLEDAGFEVIEIGDRTDFALEFFRESMAAAASTPASPGVHIVMGERAGEKMKNVVENIQRGRIAPVQMIAVRE